MTSKKQIIFVKTMKHLCQNNETLILNDLRKNDRIIKENMLKNEIFINWTSKKKRERFDAKFFTKMYYRLSSFALSDHTSVIWFSVFNEKKKKYNNYS